VARDPGQVEEEVVKYFEALFQGRHVGGEGAAPVDSGSPFRPDFVRLGDFLKDVPVLEADESTLLDLPINMLEMQAALETASVGRSLGLDGLTYEFYKAVFGWVGPPTVDALNTMLEEGQLAPSLCQGVIRLLPKVRGVPMASQLRPITLLNTDYKLLTKVYMARLLQVLPKFLAKGQLCLVRGKNIMQGAILLWSTAEFDLLIIDTVCRQFEMVSGAILNRSHKAAILGLGTGLAGRPGHCLGLVPRSP
jgi:hypothetical protein